LKLKNVADVLVLGAGPAALCIAAELVQQGLNVQAIASKSPLEPWPNTYGIWAAELESLNMEELLKYRWKDTVSFFGDGLRNKGNICTSHNQDYDLYKYFLYFSIRLQKN
jgi:lycopene beta-cyclase